MNNWFTVKVKYTKQLDNGALKRVSEPYLLAAMNYSDAETRIYEELGQVIRGEFNVVGITRTEIHDIFHYEDSDVWYKCKIKYQGVASDSEKARKVTQVMLVSANSVKQAYERLEECLSTLMVDFEVPSVIVSPIVEIFPYTENVEQEEVEEVDNDEITEVYIEETVTEDQPSGKAKAMAMALNGNEYRSETVYEDREFAKEHNLLIVYGDEDSIDSDKPSSLWVEGVIEEKHLIAVGDAVAVSGDLILWVAEYPWKFTSNYPYHKFDIMKDGEKYCEGIVMDLNK